MGIQAIISDVLLLLRYGSLRPHKLWIPEAPAPLSIDPDDKRARRLIARMAIRGEMTTARRLWIDAVRHLRPALAVDVGVNYGECLLGLTYPEGTAAIGVEANPALIPHIERSLRGHPSRDAIVLYHALVGDLDKSTAELRFNPCFSGTASAVTLPDENLPGRITVRTATLDGLIGKSISDARSIVFKLDIEGYEGRAMLGFNRLAEFDQVIGIIEFDLAHLAASGVDGPTLLEMLLARYEVFETSKGIREIRRIRSLAELLAAAPTDKHGPHTDLLIMTPGVSLPPMWGFVK